MTLTAQQAAQAAAEGTAAGIEAGIPTVPQSIQPIVIETGLPPDLLAVFNAGLRDLAVMTGVYRELKALNAKIGAAAKAQAPEAEAEVTGK